MYIFSGSGRITGFKSWLDAHLPSCNDNDDPDHDNTVIAADPDRDEVPIAPVPEWAYSPSPMPGLG